MPEIKATTIATLMSIAGHDYRRLAELHRPQDQNGLRLAARDLACQGLRERDIAAALGLSPAAVTALLKARAIASSAETAALHQTA